MEDERLVVLLPIFAFVCAVVALWLFGGFLSPTIEPAVIDYSMIISTSTH